jgi:hypothetical protein
MKLSEIVAKEEARYAGKWVSIDEFYPGVRLRIRPIDHPDVRRRNFQDAVGGSSNLDFDATEAQNARLLSEIIVVDWSGLDGDDGTPLPFSREKAFEWFSIPILEALRRKIVSEAVALRDAKLAELEDDSKN